MAPAEQSHADLLRQTRLFAGLGAGAIEQLERRSRVRNYRRGETVFIADEPGDCLYVVISGLVKVFVSSPRGDDLVLATVGPGDAFGELSILDGGGRSASAEAVDAATLLILDRSNFMELIREHPELVDRLLATLGALVRRLTDQAADLAFLDMHGRVAKLLLHLSDSVAGGDAPLSDIEIPFNQSDLARMVGASRQTVNQILRGFQATGCITLSGRRLRILRPDALQRRASD